MDDYLKLLIIRIENAEKADKQYFYSREESDDPHAEVSGLKELERLGHITCGRFIQDMESTGGYFAVGGPCRLTYSGRRVLATMASRPIVAAVREVASSIEKSFEGTLAHLEQASKQLLSLEDERARKDAVRDCISAVEAMLKSITGKSDIKDATAELKRLSIGPDFIVKDGLSIWDHVHRTYPDVRHGQGDTTPMPKAQAVFLVERAIAYIKYLASTIDSTSLTKVAGRGA